LITLGSDYSGSKVFLGLLSDNHVVGTVEIDTTFPKKGVDMLRSIFKEWVDDWNLDKLWAEEAWVNGQRFPKSGMMLSRTAAFLEIAALDSGIHVEFIHPMTWRRTVYGHAKPANPKEAARTYVKELFGWETKFKKDHNTCEAILLAHYGALKNNE